MVLSDPDWARAAKPATLAGGFLDDYPLSEKLDLFQESTSGRGPARADPFGALCDQAQAVGLATGSVCDGDSPMAWR